MGQLIRKRLATQNKQHKFIQKSCEKKSSAFIIGGVCLQKLFHCICKQGEMTKKLNILALKLRQK
jgi:hypothetical protein